jgi:hypothetical protein
MTRSPLLDRLATPLGYGLLAVGGALMVLPGPGIPFLLGGLALLARHRPWARRALRRLRLHVARRMGRGRPGTPSPGARGRRARALSAGAALLLAAGLPGAARAGAVPWLDLETGGVWSGYNDVRIPGRGGTRFSLHDDLTTSAAPYTRVRAGIELGRHEVSALYAPLRLSAAGVAPGDIAFSGTTFAAGTPLRGSYRFDSYRLGWRYRVVDGERLQLSLGATAKIRDAAIAVCAATCTVRSDTGFVPLASFRLHWSFAPPFGLLLDGDALAGGPGRAEDVTLAVTWKAADNVGVRAGWRIVEGGADTRSVYNFALLSYLGAGVTVRF